MNIRNSREPLILPLSLENRREEFQSYVEYAKEKLQQFIEEYDLLHDSDKSFMDNVLFFDDKKKFDKKILNLVDADPSTQLPKTCCAALEKRTLLAVSPELYAEIYPQGIEERSFEKLLIHEMAHRLHIELLNGDEEAMGPVWFFEGFAIFVADQFSNSDLILSNKEMIDIIREPNRMSYLKYGVIFRFFCDKIPLLELISKANNEDFNEKLISLIK